MTRGKESRRSLPPSELPAHEARMVAHEERVERDEPAEQREARERNAEGKREAGLVKEAAFLKMRRLLKERGPLTSGEICAALFITQRQFRWAVYSARGKRAIEGTRIGTPLAKRWRLTKEGEANAEG